MFSNLTFKISSVLLSSKVLRKQIEWCPYPSVAWRSALVHRTMCRMSLHLSTSTLTPCVIHPSSRIRIILIFGIKTILISTLEFWNTQKQHLIWILGRIGLPNPYPNFTKIRITYPGLKYPILRFNPIHTNLIQITNVLAQRNAIIYVSYRLSGRGIAIISEVRGTDCSGVRKYFYDLLPLEPSSVPVGVSIWTAVPTPLSLPPHRGNPYLNGECTKTPNMHFSVHHFSITVLTHPVSRPYCQANEAGKSTT